MQKHHSQIFKYFSAVLLLAKLPLQCHYNERDGVSIHRRLDCLINRLFKQRSKKTSKFRVTGLCEGIHRWPVNSPRKGQQRGKRCHLMTSWCGTASYNLENKAGGLQQISRYWFLWLCYCWSYSLTKNSIPTLVGLIFKNEIAAK